MTQKSEPASIGNGTRDRTGNPKEAARRSGAVGERGKEGPALCLDLHIHSDASPDSEATPKAIIDAVRTAGLHGLALTDHNSVANNERMAELARRAGLLFIPGCEVSSAKGHILTYAMDREMPRNLPPDQVVRMAQLSGSLVAASHPYRLVTGVGPILSMDLPFDALEVLNAHSSPSANAKAATLAESIRLWRKEAPREDLFADGEDKDETRQRDAAWARMADDVEHAYSGRTDDEPDVPPLNARSMSGPPPRLSRGLPLATIGGSDAHIAQRVGLAWTEFPGLSPDSATVDDVLEALGKGDCRARGESSSALAFDYQLKVAWNRLRRGLRRI